MKIWRVIPLLLAAWLYMPAVRLPLFWDDVIHFRYVSGVSTGHLLTKTELVSYYRPLVNLILQIPFLLDAHPSAPLWHLILVLNHVLNVALVGALTKQLRLGWVVQFWAMTIFAAYPFSFQAVVWVLAWFHPLVVTLILVACIMGLRGMRHPQKQYAAWIAGAIAPFVHENGVLTAPLLALLILYAVPRRALRKDWRRALVVLLPIAAGAALYGLIALRLGVGAGEGNTLDDVRFNLSYLVQGVVFPVMFLLENVWVGGLIFLGIGVLILRRDALRWRSVAMGMAWFVLAGLPIVILLQETYVTSAPRLLYLGSVGIALAVGVLVEHVTLPKRENLVTLPYKGYEKLLAMNATILMLVIVIFSANYARGRLALHNQLGVGYHQLHDGLREQDQSARTLVINAPMWLDTETQTESATFPLGKNGAIFIPDSYALFDFVWANTGINFEQIDAVFYYPTVDAWPEHISGLNGTQAIDAGTMQGFIREHDIVYAFYVRDAAHFSARNIGQRAVERDEFLAEFADGMRLVSMENNLTDDGLIAVGLTWQRMTDAPVLERPFLHLICDGEIVDQVDAHPIGNMYHFNAWQVGESWTEYRYLDANGAAESCLMLRLGLYDEVSGERSEVVGAGGEEFLILLLE